MLSRSKILLLSTMLILFTKEVVLSTGIATESTESEHNSISYYSTVPAATTSIVLDFDDIQTSPNGPVDVAMPPNYGELQWENFRVVNGDYPPIYATGYKLGRVTSPNTAYNANATPAAISSAVSFDFISVYLAVAYSSTDEPSEVQIEGFAGGVLKYMTRVSVRENSPTFATLNFYGIDRLVFTSLVNPHDNRISQFVMDQFIYNSDLGIQLPRIINASVSGKKLFLSGENFGIGAELLMNGKKQKKTYNDEVHPTTLLIGKKSGKLIDPGQTVILQVRNLDGTLSAEFSYTRPASDLLH